MRYSVEDEPDITAEEIEEVEKKKAVSDRIPNEAVKEIWKVAEVFQKSCAKGIFSKMWKQVSLLWIPPCSSPH